MNNFLINLSAAAGLVLLAILIWLRLRQRITVPGNYQLRRADFDPRNIRRDDLDDPTVFIGDGSLTNDLGQTFSITVIGSSDSSVIDYFNVAKFHLEIREPIDIPNSDEKPKQLSSKLGDLPVQTTPDERPEPESSRLPDLSIRELFKEDHGNVRVSFDLSPDMIEKYPQGSMLVVVDPPIQQNRVHNYSAKRASGRVNVTLEVTDGEGTVTGILYFDCNEKRRKTARRRRPPRPENLRWKGSGFYDLVIRGDRGENDYEVHSLWEYGHQESSRPDITGPRGRCP